MFSFNRTMSMIASGIFLFAGLIYFGVQAMLVSHVGGMMWSMNEIENPKDPLKKSKLKIVNHRHPDHSGFREGYQAFGRPDDIKADRRVAFATYANLESLLEKGEARPSKSMEEVFAKARSVEVARDECALILEIFASACDVEYVDARMEDHYVKVSGSLRFVESAALPTFDPQATWSYEHVSAPLSEQPRQSAAATAKSDRRALYRRAVAQCGEIAKREGNCRLHSIRLHALRRDGYGIELSGQAGFSFLSRVDR
jgi:hypothetical protein